MSKQLKSLYIREWGKIHLIKEDKDFKDYTNIDNIYINSKSWEQLSKFANSDKKDNRFLRLHNKNTLKVQNFVGVITTPDGTQIEILPKIEDKASSESAGKSRKILAKMLRIVNNLDFIETTKASLQIQNKPIPEILIGWFLSCIDIIVKKGIRKDYIRVARHEKFLKGQLQLQKQVNEPPHHQHLFHIEYDILSPNRAENRLIHSALVQISKWSRDNHNQSLAKHLIMLFDEVPLSKNYLSDFAKWSTSRDMNYYQSALPWLKLILNQQSPFTLKGKYAGISFLIPMEKLFEKYVAKILASKLNNKYTLTEQKPQKALAYSNKKAVFNMRPDIVVSHKNREDIRLVLDTKWKLIDGKSPTPIYGKDNNHTIKQSDMYQLFAYGKKYKVKRVILIYPSWSKFNKKLFYKFDDNLSLAVIPFPLNPAPHK
jgi:5-methylcytosine-specific restriction enzyme subunit McrC